jgi:hypothetical protein
VGCSGLREGSGIVVGVRPIGLRRASGGVYGAARTRSRAVTFRTVRAFETTGTGWPVAG